MTSPRSPMAGFESARVGDVMHPGILSCDPDAGLAEIAWLMSSHLVHCIVVMAVARDASRERLVWGTVSDLDLVRARVSPDGPHTAGALAKQPIVCIAPDRPLQEAAELMLSHGTTHLVVVEPHSQRPVGVVSTLDVVGAIARSEPAPDS
jgi:CBS domain-containing protein